MDYATASCFQYIPTLPLTLDESIAKLTPKNMFETQKNASES